MTLVDRKKAILHAAVELFAENGFAETSTSAIAKKANVAEGLIFHYFKSKKGILISILDDSYKFFIGELKNIVIRSISGLEMIKQIALLHFDFRKKKFKKFQMLVKDIPPSVMDPNTEDFKKITEHINNILEIIKTAVQKGQQDGSIRRTPLDETALIIRGTLVGISSLTGWFHNQSDSLNISPEVVKFICRSLSSDRGGI